MPRGSAVTVRLDRRAELAKLAAYTPEEVQRILATAGEEGALAAASVVHGAIPVGRSRGRSVLYRKLGLTHGALRGSVRAARFRSRATGWVVGPIGRAAFTRHWIELGNRRGERAQHPVERVASRAATAARVASDRELDRYARDH